MTPRLAVGTLARTVAIGVVYAGAGVKEKSSCVSTSCAVVPVNSQSSLR